MKNPIQTRIGLFSFLLLNGLCLMGQSVFPKRNYPENYFINPVDTAFSIVGNFGECRLNHFHSGIDIRTNGEENHRVFAAASGYVSRIKIEPGGFGNALYINHPNGYTTVYAHLNRFREDIEQWVRQEQYRTQSWRQDIVLSPNQFPLKQGDTIALSGNTGSSEGPHVHFEIRNTATEVPVNALLFFPQYADQVQPKIRQLAVYNADLSIYRQTPVFVPVKQISPGNYEVAKTNILLASNPVFFGLGIDDFSETATGTLGIYELQLFVNDQLQFAWQLDSIGFDITRYMNAHADYSTKKKTKQWIQLAHQLPNDRLGIYKFFQKEKGIIDFKENTSRNMRIDCYDVAMNKTSIHFTLANNLRDTLHSLCTSELAAGKAHRLEEKGMLITLDDKALYDDICFNPELTINPSTRLPEFQLGDGTIPLHTPMHLSFSIKMIDSMYKKLALVREEGQERKGQALIYKDGLLHADLKEMGRYKVVIDNVQPQITSSIKNGDSLQEDRPLSFVVEDETTSVVKVSMKVAGQWLRVVQQRNRFYYEPDDYFPAGQHTLRVSATDQNNNVVHRDYILKRKTK